MATQTINNQNTRAYRGVLVLDLADIHAAMLPLVGGKAANLGEMIRAGLPVPPGVCVTTAAYRQVASSVAIDFDMLASARPAEVQEAARKTRESLLGAPVAMGVADAIISAYNKLGRNVPVAVRSSATAEDLPFASFAGQQDTYLHVIGERQVLDAVRRCWASLWTERAVVYRTTNVIDHRAVQIAVVIQRMVDSATAGVLFTANPVSGRRRQAVIDASDGLGEAVVSGAVNPDHFVVDTGSGEILERRLGDKRVMVRSLPGGGSSLVECPAGSNRACITDEQVRKIASLGARVEAHYHAPQDIEWAINGKGELWLTQARPITTLFPLPADAPAEGLRVYFCFSVAQGLYRPLTPMGLSAARTISSAAARLLGIPVDDHRDGAPVFAEAGQRVFIDLTSVLRGRIGRVLMPRVLDVMESRSAVILRRLCEDQRLSITHRSPFLFIGRILRMAVRYAAPLRILQALFVRRQLSSRSNRSAMIWPNVSLTRAKPVRRNWPSLSARF